MRNAINESEFSRVASFALVETSNALDFVGVAAFARTPNSDARSRSLAR